MYEYAFRGFNFCCDNKICAGVRVCVDEVICLLMTERKFKKN